MPSECSPGVKSTGLACRACSSPGVPWFCSDSPEIGSVFEKGLMAHDRGSGTGSAGEVMDLIRRLLRLREGVCVVFENGSVLMEDWVLRKYVKPRILERGVEAGLSVVKGLGDDDDAVGINEWVLMQQ